MFNLIEYKFIQYNYVSVKLQAKMSTISLDQELAITLIVISIQILRKWNFYAHSNLFQK